MTCRVSLIQKLSLRSDGFVLRYGAPSGNSLYHSQRLSKQTLDAVLSLPMASNAPNIMEHFLDMKVGFRDMNIITQFHNRLLALMASMLIKCSGYLSCPFSF